MSDPAAQPCLNNNSDVPPASGNSSVLVIGICSSFLLLWCALLFYNWLRSRREVESDRLRENGEDDGKAIQHASQRKRIIAQLLITEWNKGNDAEGDIHDAADKSDASSDCSATLILPVGDDDQETDVDKSLKRETLSASQHSESLRLSGNDECAICLGNFRERERICRSNNPSCKHLFHEGCMAKWLWQHDECPVCREIYVLEKV